MQKRSARQTRNTIATGLMVAALLAAIPVSQAYAAQIDASLIPEYGKAAGIFSGVKFVQLEYAEGSAVSDLVNGRTGTVTFSIKGTEERGIREVVAAVNQALVNEESPAQIKSANLTYTGTFKGGPDRLSLSYSVQLVPAFSGFVLEQDNTTGDEIIMDINWRGFTVEGPIIIDTEEYGEIDINRPIGLLQATFPEFAGTLLDSEAREIMMEPILDFGEIGAVSMEKWHSLFDPTISQISAKGLLRGEDIGRAKVLFVYSLGECSIREGCPSPKESEVSVVIDGTPVQVRISTPQPNSQIQIAGYTEVKKVGDGEIIVVDLEERGFALPSFTIQVLLVLGGMMGAIAVFVLFKARK